MSQGCDWIALEKPLSHWHIRRVMWSMEHNHNLRHMLRSKLSSLQEGKTRTHQQWPALVKIFKSEKTCTHWKQNIIPFYYGCGSQINHVEYCLSHGNQIFCHLNGSKAERELKVMSSSCENVLLQSKRDFLLLFKFKWSFSQKHPVTLWWTRASQKICLMSRKLRTFGQIYSLKTFRKTF